MRPLPSTPLAQMPDADVLAELDLRRGERQTLGVRARIAALEVELLDRCWDHSGEAA